MLNSNAQEVGYLDQPLLNEGNIILCTWSETQLLPSTVLFSPFFLVLNILVRKGKECSSRE